MAITGGPIFRHAQIRWDASHCRSGFNHQLYTHFEHLAAHASIPHGQVFFHRVLRILSLYLDDRGRKKGHQSYQPYRMMVSARIGTPKKSQQNGFNIIIPDWKGPIHSFSGVFFGFNSFMYVYYICNIMFSSHLHPSAPAKTRWAAQRLKKQRVLRSQRGLPFSLSPMRTTSKSHSPVQERVLHHVTFILVCSHTAPYYIPGILFWVCNSPWACCQATE